ncbi:hypothetical protein TYRP_020158 [Tyrophagus putrescentiae]|nr:hypothetical protein TYRP_020158 [Tyrophagus putrescentiae]
MPWLWSNREFMEENNIHFEGHRPPLEAVLESPPMPADDSADVTEDTTDLREGLTTSVRQEPLRLPLLSVCEGLVEVIRETGGDWAEDSVTEESESATDEESSEEEGQYLSQDDPSVPVPGAGEPEHPLSRSHSLTVEQPSEPVRVPATHLPKKEDDDRTGRTHDDPPERQKDREGPPFHVHGAFSPLTTDGDAQQSSRVPDIPGLGAS